MVWNLFKTELFAKQNEKISLYQKLKQELPQADESSLFILTSMAGLLCSVAFSDMNISTEERVQIKAELKKWGRLNDKEISLIAQMSLDEIKGLSNIDTHQYSDYLGNHLPIEDRYQVLLALFKLAASCEGVSVLEAEEIRILCKGLLLEHKHFIAAQATVKEHLNSLKKI